MENQSGGEVTLKGRWDTVSAEPLRQWAGITCQSKYLVISYISWILPQGLKHVTTYILNYIWIVDWIQHICVTTVLSIHPRAVRSARWETSASAQPVCSLCLPPVSESPAAAKLGWPQSQQRNWPCWRGRKSLGMSIPQGKRAPVPPSCSGQPPHVFSNRLALGQACSPSSRELWPVGTNRDLLYLYSLWKAAGPCSVHAGLGLPNLPASWCPQPWRPTPAPRGVRQSTLPADGLSTPFSSREQFLCSVQPLETDLGWPQLSVHFRAYCFRKIPICWSRPTSTLLLYSNIPPVLSSISYRGRTSCLSSEAPHHCGCSYLKTSLKYLSSALCPENLMVWTFLH